MGMQKITCPNCGKILTVNPKSKYKKCPICGADLFEKPINLPPLVVRHDIYNLEDFLTDGFQFLYFKAYDKLFDLSLLMLKIHPDNFYSYLFNLIGKTEIDFIFLLKDLNMKLEPEEMDEDLRSRYYYYARKKYNKSPQKVFSRISSYYPDLPGDKRGKWEKARTKYDEYFETTKRYMKISDMIHIDYMENFNRTAKNEDEMNILKNIQIWLDQVSHAYLDLYRYDQKADEMVKQDFTATPFPGNKPKFSAYLMVYILSLLTLILGVSDIIVSIINGGAIGGLHGYLLTTIFNTLLISALILWFINGSMFENHPLLAVVLVILSILLVASGFLTVNVRARINFYSIFYIVLSLVMLLISIFKGIQYMPRPGLKTGTVIGDLQKLSNNSFEIKFDFDWKKYEGKHLAKIAFKEAWLRGDE